MNEEGFLERYKEILIEEYTEEFFYEGEKILITNMNLVNSNIDLIKKIIKE